jgi:TatD DNase family protein
MSSATTPSTIIDIGVNLSSKQFEGYHAELLEHAYQAYVEAIICISNSQKDWRANLDLIEKHKNSPVKLFSTLGIHPHNAKQATDSTWEEFQQFYSKNKKFIVAIGECGLDFNRKFSPQDTQITVFQRQIELGRELDLPLYMHERDAAKEMIEILQKSAAEHKEQPLRGVIHCFTGDKSTLQAYLDLGLYIGITGWITDHRRNGELLEALRILPLERLLIETDAPFLCPLPYQKQWKTRRAEPDCLDYIIKAISEATGYGVEEIRQNSTTNAKKLFNLK